MRPSFLARLSDAGSHAVPENIALELREDGEHAGESAAAGRGHIERLAQ